MSKYVLTALLRPVPRPASTSQSPTEDHDSLSVVIITALTALCADYSFTIVKESIKPLDTTSLNTPRAIQVLLELGEDADPLAAQSLKTSQSLRDFEHRFNIDVAIQPYDAFHTPKRLVVFDMDSTLIQQEVIDEIAAFVGVKDKVAEITERAMRGELDFSASLRSRCALLSGVPATVFETLKHNGTITFTPGAHSLCRALKRQNCTLAVLSGGFQPLAEWVKSTLGLDYAFANTLEISPDGSELTGQVLGDIVNAERKAYLLKHIAEKEGIPLPQTVAVGDGANDLVMMAAAGFGVAFNAKPKVQIEAPAHVNTTTLQDILYLFGLTKQEQDSLVGLASML
ncbi:hypothetical protein H072_9601 [Dactylellina haptotyla CBS 200.50]|uniref:phosphoserine phosphatase n=1 Tax=Dactylellina haptotyla (strain CBS 200.50) TaxID=1284197 RepID=S8BCA5_DACHA|nr:hypothetical protein H072_9601 [Dactylellina haptotyla CBS 200.50]